MNKLKIVFAGTPVFAMPSLEEIFKSNHELIAIYTQPDRKSGRGQKLQAPPVKLFAQEHNIPVYQPLNFKNTKDIGELANLKPDVIIVIAYGLILPKEVLEIPKYGCINVHASILPRFRGASPIQQSILSGDSETGVTIMQMDEGMDTGDILLIEKTKIEENETAASLHDKLSRLATKPLMLVLDNLINNKIQPQKQDDTKKTYAGKITKEDAHVDWQQDADYIARLIRAFNPWPVAWTHANDTIIKIFQAKSINEHSNQAPGNIIDISNNGIKVATGNGILLIEKLQFPCSKIITVKDFINGSRKELYISLILK